MKSCVPVYITCLLVNSLRIYFVNKLPLLLTTLVSNFKFNGITYQNHCYFSERTENNVRGDPQK